MNDFLLNGGILKVIGLELAKRGSVLCLTYYTMSDLTTLLIRVGLTDAKGAIVSQFTVRRLRGVGKQRALQATILCIVTRQ